MGNYLSVFYWICIMDIETKRLLLRPLRDDDAPVMARRLNNYEISKNLGRVKFPYSLADATEFIAFQQSYDARSKICAITFKCAPDEILGLVSYKYFTEKDKTEFGYWLSECCWGQRIMTEAATALLDYAFTKAEIMELHASYWNPVSGHLLRNLRFKETHESMSFCLAQNTKVPTTKLKLTRAQWQAMQ
jgi:RimJ/RimL family protein N-acetyltransferase